MVQSFGDGVRVVVPLGTTEVAFDNSGRLVFLTGNQ